MWACWKQRQSSRTKSCLCPDRSAVHGSKHVYRNHNLLQQEVVCPPIQVDWVHVHMRRALVFQLCYLGYWTLKHHLLLRIPLPTEFLALWPEWPWKIYANPVRIKPDSLLVFPTIIACVQFLSLPRFSCYSEKSILPKFKENDVVLLGINWSSRGTLSILKR